MARQEPLQTAVARRKLCATASPFTFEVGLVSDLHLECPQTDIGKIRKELDSHAENGRDVWVNGDVFDAILTKDLKRYSRGAHFPETTDEIANDALDRAEALFAPYKNIKGMGIGNHEDAQITHGGVNLVKLLIERLQDRHSQSIEYMGWTGVLAYQVDYAPAGKRAGGWTVLIHYHHGAGGAERVGKGANALYHFGAWSPDADVLWLGHKHDILTTKACFMRVGPALNVYPHVQTRVQTGAYLSPFKMSYARKKNLPPQPMGGATIKVELSKGIEGFSKSVRVEM